VVSAGKTPGPDRSRAGDATAATSQDPTPTGSRCPVCGAPGLVAYRPFCSGRCADVDLLRWLRGAYVIQSTGDDDEDGSDGEAPPTPRSDET